MRQLQRSRSLVNWINWAKVDPTEQDKLNKEQHESDHDGNLNKKSKENDNEFLKMDELQLKEELGMLAPAEQRIPYVRRNLLDEMNDADFFAFTRFSKDGVRRLAGLDICKIKTTSSCDMGLPSIGSHGSVVSNKCLKLLV